jgi:hypothetical protein
VYLVAMSSTTTTMMMMMMMMLMLMLRMTRSGESGLVPLSVDRLLVPSNTDSQDNIDLTVACVSLCGSDRTDHHAHRHSPLLRRQQEEPEE